MKTPKSTLELADAIESLVASYVESVREAAQQAVARATVERVASAHSSSSGTRTRAAPPQTTMARRTAAELETVCDALCARVRAQPGMSMVELAEQMNAEVRSLQRPMAKLKSASRVRSVGERHLTRYYPAVVGTAGVV